MYTTPATGHGAMTAPSNRAIGPNLTHRALEPRQQGKALFSPKTPRSRP